MHQKILRIWAAESRKSGSHGNLKCGYLANEDENKEMIEKRLPGVEWREAGKHQGKYSLRIDIPMDEGIENLSDERFNEITDTLSSDMKILVEIVKELKL